MIINHFGLSSGKDSTALWGWALNDSGYPIESIRGSFADTENEYPEVYEQIQKLDDYGRKRGAAPVRTLKSEGFLNLAIRKKRFPSAKARFCTEVLKILPSMYYFEELWLEGHEIIAHSGVRGDESNERALMPEWQMMGFRRGKTVEPHMVRRPLLKWTIQDVWDAHRRYGLPINKLYGLGRKRVGCRLCCMSNKGDVKLTAKHSPWVIDVYREWEKIVGAVVNQGSIASFFPSRTIPNHLHSIKGLIRQRDGLRGKKGDLYSVCTIDDVVKWSRTARGGKQLPLDFEEDDSHAPCQSGYCE